jgi:hypothetical protein
MGIEGTFVVEVRDLEHLNRVIGAMKSIDGIVEVERREYLGSHELGVVRGGVGSTAETVPAPVRGTPRRKRG